MPKQGFFLNERAMKAASVTAAVCGVVSLALAYFVGEWTALNLFEQAVKVLIAVALFVSFAQFKWNLMRGLMGAMLFALLYQEAFLVIGRLWGETTDFDKYLIMGVQGSLYLSAATMSFMMTVIITVNHFILEYTHAGNRFNMIFNQFSILFKLLLYVMLLVLNMTLDLPAGQLAARGVGYIADFAIIIMVICIESQLDDFKKLRQELLDERKAGARHE